MIPSNDNQLGRRPTISVESGDGDMQGLFLVCLVEPGTTEPIDTRIFESKDDAFAFARELMTAYPLSAFQDETEGDDK